MFKCAMKTNRTNKKTNSKKRYILFAAVAALSVILLLFVLERTHVTNLYGRWTKTSVDQPYKINYGPPTQQEQQAGDKQKQTIVDQQSAPQAPPSTATVVVARAEQNGDTIEVAASITNVYKDGTCTFKLVQGSNSLTKITAAYRDVSTTICTNPLIPRSEFPTTGDWQVTVSYKSSDGISGQSESKTIKIE